MAKPVCLYICWFRRNLRIHDNLLLAKASHMGDLLIPLYIIDPLQVTPSLMSVNRVGFLLESLRDLDQNLAKEYQQRLFVTFGQPLEILNLLVSHIKGFWGFKGKIMIGIEKDFQPYHKVRDSTISQWAQNEQVFLQTATTQTLWNVEMLGKKNHFLPCESIEEFKLLISDLDEPQKDFPPPESLPPAPKELFINQDSTQQIVNYFGQLQFFNQPPSIYQLDMGYQKKNFTSGFQGGESSSLQRLNMFMKDIDSITTFSKHINNPTITNPGYMIQNPYLALGCLSVRKFYHTIQNSEQLFKNDSSLTNEDPEKSENLKMLTNLKNFLVKREFFYMTSCYTRNFDKMYNNPISKLTDCWEYNMVYINAWKKGATGFPVIDAIMKQLEVEGFTHKFNLHLVACFLTKGTLWQTWEVGLSHFQRNLICFDWSINTSVWIFLTNSNLGENYRKVNFFSLFFIFCLYCVN